MPDSTAWENRIVGEDLVLASELKPNPANWRLHPGEQAKALEAILDEIGWVQRVVVNKRTGNLIDGHLRRDMAEKRGEKVPVIYVDLDEEDELKILAVLDPIGELAKADHLKLNEIIDKIEVDNEELSRFMQSMVKDADAATGDALALVDVIVKDPEIEVMDGDVWRCGKHMLCCMDVATDHGLWKQYLTDDHVLAPYAGPFMLLSEIAATRPVLIVQPDKYLAAYTLERWNEQHPDRPARKSELA